ncbi:protein eyes shut-like isoform X2 [Littorina saxatilis]|uniref:protein eyes shut-like isoform X2 n=1 Tax=Littorina saxatilis TaxID=31220 RepID=UPI0038B68F62
MTALDSTHLVTLIGILCVGIFLYPTVNCNQTNPLEETDVLQSFRVSNSLQCQRLCWYRKQCVRFSFYDKNDNPAGSEDNCVLHVNRGEGQQLMEAWREELATSKEMSSTHWCKSRACSDTQMCVPMATRSTCIHVPTKEAGKCHSHPCQNGAVCTDGIPQYSCACGAGYSGSNCETDIDECVSSPCQNGGNCVDKVSAYTCNCPAGWTGRNCESDIDECVSSPCQNGGNCVDQVNKYTCNCPAGWTGSKCESATWLGQQCNAGYPCGASGRECRDGECVCDADGGYYYSHSQNDCVQDCAEFGTDYDYYYNNDFYGHNAFSLHAEDVAVCKEGCNNVTACRTFTRIPSQNMCYFKFSTRQEYPGDWLENGNGDVETYQRTCV